jgi:predicted nucleotidyltransferase
MNNPIEYWLKKRKKIQEKNQTKARQVRNNLEPIIKLLVDEFGATKIILFGSLLTNKFHQESDIDLAVEGIQSRDYFRALAKVNDLGECPIDLKPMEDLDPYFLGKVLQKGQCIYEKNHGD